MWAVTHDFQQCGNLKSADSDKPVQPPFKLTNSKWCSVSSLTVIEYSSNQQRLWSDCTYAQADLRLCWSHIPHCWKSYAGAHVLLNLLNNLRKRDKLWHFLSILSLLCNKFNNFCNIGAQILDSAKITLKSHFSCENAKILPYSRNIVMTVVT